MGNVAFELLNSILTHKYIFKFPKQKVNKATKKKKLREENIYCDDLQIVDDVVPGRDLQMQKEKSFFFRQFKQCRWKKNTFI